MIPSSYALNSKKGKSSNHSIVISRLRIKYLPVISKYLAVMRKYFPVISKYLVGMSKYLPEMNKIPSLNNEHHAVMSKYFPVIKNTLL